MGRICVIIISVIALVLALSPNDTILGIVAYAWGGFGAAFGPLVLVVWKQVELDKYMYEIVPGFVFNCVTIFLVNTVAGQKDERVLRQYEEVTRVIAAGK